MILLDKRRGFDERTLYYCRSARLLPAGSVALVGLLASCPAYAQGSGVLTGRVVDASTKKPLSDVVVTATSPALQGEQTVVTDGSGAYRIPNLPPGEYSLRLDKDSFRPYGRGGISMRSAVTFQVNAELLAENVTLKAEEIVVVGKAPTVDVGSSSTGVSMNQDFTSHLPLTGGTASRSFESLATVAPGAQSDRYGVSINGTTSPENAFVIDGVSVNNPGFGILGTPLSVEFVKELNVVSGGYMPEFGRTMGGVFDVQTQSGGNKFHGSVFFNITPGALEGRRTPVITNGSVISTSPSLSSLRDFGATIGGPIVKDRLWFFAGVQAAFTRYILTRSLRELDLDPTTGEPKTDPTTGLIRTLGDKPFASKEYDADDRAIQYIGKLTYLFNQNHSIVLSVSGTPTSAGGNGTFSDIPTLPQNIVGPYAAYARYDIANASDVSLRYAGAFNNKHQLVDVTVGWHHQRSATLPNDGSAIGGKTGAASVPSVLYRRTTSPNPATTPPNHNIKEFEPVPAGRCENISVQVDPVGMTCSSNADCNSKNCALNADGMTKSCGPKIVTPCPVTTYFLGGPLFLEDQRLDSYQGKVVGTSLFTLAGHHVVKAGVDVQLASYKHIRGYSGGDAFRESFNGTTYTDFSQFGFLSAPDVIETTPKITSTSTSTTVGGFLQDSWQILDKVTLNIGFRYDTQIIYGTDGTIGLTLPNQWSPRVGVIYDFTQQGRSKIFANYARYYEGVPLDISDGSFPGDSRAGGVHSTKICDPTRPGSQLADPKANPPIPPNLFGCTDDSAPRLAVGAPNDPDQTTRRSGGDRTPVDPDIAAQSSDEFVVGGEYEIFPDARLGAAFTHVYLTRAIEDMSRDEANTYFIGNPGYGIASDFSKAKRDYDAVTFYFQKAFSNTWLAQASYTISYLRGNYSGLFRPENGQLDPNITTDFDLKSLLVNRSGPLPADSTHQIKLYGAKDFLLPGNMDVLLGLIFRTRSGSPLDYLGSHVLYGSRQAFILPRGSAGRGDWIHAFDARLGYAVKLGKQSQVGVTVDIFNLFNFQGATGHDTIYTLTNALPVVNGTTKDLPTATSPGKVKHPDGTLLTVDELNLNFLKPTSFQDPRQFRFGVKVTF